MSGASDSIWPTGEEPSEAEKASHVREAVLFLQEWIPTGPWALSAIDPEPPKDIETRSFNPASLSIMEIWIERWWGKRNLYFMVNPPKRMINTKAKKEDVGHAIALHVDIDPRPGYDVVEEQKRISDLLDNYDPPYSIKAFSGGGYQGYWFVLPTTDHAAIERRNYALAQKLGGDKCHNIDRIMRLPGTVNLPDLRKRQKGRTAQLATIVAADWSRKYDLDVFPVGLIPTGGTGDSAEDNPEATGDDPGNFAALPKKLREQILSGDASEYDNDRSRLVFHVTCSLCRHGWTNTQIVEVLLNPDYKVSDHIREQKNPHIVAQRQVRRAREATRAKGALSEDVIALGYDHGVFYYLSSTMKQITSLTAIEHSKNACLGMASLDNYWYHQPFMKKGEVQWTEVINDMLSKCRSAGIFDTARIRGRGANFDHGRCIIHLGNRLIIDGIESPLDVTGSYHIYEAAKALDTTFADPLPTTDAKKLLAACRKLRWDEPLSGTLLAGWLALAPICGGLEWRPHINLTGASGSGKTTALSLIINPVLGPMMLSARGSTTEAGLRQTLKNDALPVLLDEAEAGEFDHNRLQSIIDLARQASSESDAAVFKGSRDQKHSKSYNIRSMFLFSSVNFVMKSAADESRITRLSLKVEKVTEESREKFSILTKECIETFTPEFASGLLARSVQLLPVIRKNAKIFAQAVAIQANSQRFGDQLGTLLAGAYSLINDGEVTLEAAIADVKQQLTDSWMNKGALLEERKDEVKVLAVMLQTLARIETDDNGTVERTIGQLIAIAAHKDWDGDTDGKVKPETATIFLRQRGFRVDDFNNGKKDYSGLRIINNHSFIKKALKDTPWEDNWNVMLQRLPGAEASGPQRFGPGAAQRCTYIPWDVALGSDTRRPWDSAEGASGGAAPKRGGYRSHLTK